MSSLVFTNKKRIQYREKEIEGRTGQTKKRRRQKIPSSYQESRGELSPTGKGREGNSLYL